MRNNSWAGWPQRLLVVAGIVLLTGGIVQAGPWSNPSGVNPAFGWSDGQNSTDKFGSPVVYEWGFDFRSMNDFRAVVGAQATDIAEVWVDVRTPDPDGPAIRFIKVEEWGTWSKEVSVPSDFATCYANFSVFRQAPLPMGNTGILALPAFDLRSDGTWYSWRELVAVAGTTIPPYADKDWIRFKLTVSNTLQVIDTAPSGSFIEKTGMRITVPEPASVLFVLSGLVPLALRGRRQ